MTTQDRIFADLNQECEALESTLGTCNHQGQLIIADDHQLFECIFENEAGTMTTIFFAWFQGLGKRTHLKRAADFCAFPAPSQRGLNLCEAIQHQAWV